MTPSSSRTRRGSWVAYLVAVAVLLSSCGGVEAGTAGEPGTEPSPAPTAAASPSPQPAPTIPADPTQAVPEPAKRRGFALVVKTDGGDLSAPVAPLSVQSHELVDPPHATDQQWNTAAWIVQAAYPAVPSRGTTYVYGHACRHRACAFTNLKQAKPGDTVVVTTSTGTLTYVIRRVGLSSKSASSLPGWASNSTVKDRLVLVTCEIESGELTSNNVVITARLTASSPRRSQS